MKKRGGLPRCGSVDEIMGERGLERLSDEPDIALRPSPAQEHGEEEWCYRILLTGDERTKRSSPA